MKHNSKLLLALLLVVGSIISCKKEENKIYLEGGTQPVLKASVSGSIPLQFVTENSQAIKLSWTNPDFKFTTGVSSQDVTYTIQIDTVGANFSSVNKVEKDISKALEYAFTQKELNDFLLNSFNLTPAKLYTIELRVVATISGKAAPLPSNVFQFTVTPYATPPKVAPPTAGTLWVIGDAFASGWNNPLPVPYDGSQKFTQVTPTIYELTVAMAGGGNYKLIQENGVWGSQYHMLAGGTWEGGDFEKKDSDPGFPGGPSAGNYKITVDFQKGKFTVVKL